LLQEESVKQREADANDLENLRDRIRGCCEVLHACVLRACIIYTSTDTKTHTHTHMDTHTLTLTHTHMHAYACERAHTCTHMHIIRYDCSTPLTHCQQTSIVFDQFASAVYDIGNYQFLAPHTRTRIEHVASAFSPSTSSLNLNALMALLGNPQATVSLYIAKSAHVVERATT
jgi:hypothetical protein